MWEDRDQDDAAVCKGGDDEKEPVDGETADTMQEDEWHRRWVARARRPGGLERSCLETTSDPILDTRVWRGSSGLFWPWGRSRRVSFATCRKHQQREFMTRRGAGFVTTHPPFFQGKIHFGPSSRDFWREVEIGYVAIGTVAASVCHRRGFKTTSTATDNSHLFTLNNQHVSRH